MRKIYTTLIVVALFCASMLSSMAQVSSNYVFSQSNGTFVPLVGGTQIIAPNTDDGNSVVIDLGFTFTFNGTNFTQFRANSNGHIRLGSVITTGQYFPISTITNTNAISLFGRDGRAFGGVFTQVSGVAPDRVFTIEYSQFQVQWDVPGARIDMQLKLYETSNKIEIVYGSSTQTATNFDGQVGLRGSNLATDFNNRTTTTDWSATTAGTANSNTVRLNNTVFPLSGLTYTWTLATCLAPTAVTTSNITTNSADASWTAGGTETAWDVYAGPTPLTAPNSSTVPTIAGLTSPNLTVPGLSPSTQYAYYVRADCGAGDFSGWVGPFTFTTECNLFTVPSTIEGFETPAIGALPVCWDRQQVVGTANWGTSATTGDITTVASGNRFVRLNWGTNNSLLYSPGFDYSTVSDLTRVRALFHRHASAAASDVYRVYVNTSKSLAGATQIFELFSRTTTAPAVASTGWYEYDALIPASFHGEPILYVIFEGSLSSGASSYDLGLDNIIVEFVPACIAPSGITLDGVGNDFATISWTENGTATLWDIEYGTAGFTQGDGTEVLGLDETEYEITGLNPGTSYDVYVRADCGADQSTWVGPFTFTTELCEASEKCTYRLDLIDSFNDGWDGTVLGLRQNGIIVATFGQGFNTGGTFGPVFVDLCDNQSTDIVVVTLGSFTGEKGFTLTDPFGTVLFTRAPGTGFNAATVFHTFTTNCTPPACLAPSDITLDGVGNDFANISWTENGTATLWDIEYGTAGFTQGDGTEVLGIDETEYEIIGLNPGTSYDVYVRADCGADQSTWVGPFTFTTCPIALPLPFQEDFNASTVLPSGWNFTVSSPGSGNDWYISPNQGNPTNGLTVNLWSLNSQALAELPLIGPFPDNALLTFDYRIMNWVSNDNPTVGTTLGAGNFLFLVASNDCGENYFIIDTLVSNATHVTSNQFANLSVDLSSLEGFDINLGFFGQWASGDYFISIDNINIVTPPADLTDVTANPTNICAGDDAILTADGVEGDVQWFDDACGGNLIGTGASITVNPTVTTTYFARNFDNGLASENCLSVTVDVNAGLSVDIIANGALEFCEGEEVVLTANVPNNNTPEVFIQWNFNGPSATDVPGGAASPQTSIGVGSAFLVGGTTATFASGIASGGSSDPILTVPSNYGWNVTNFPPQGTAPQTAGVEFNVSTLGYTNIQFQFDQRFSNTSSALTVVLYNLDVTDVNSIWEVAEILPLASSGDIWINERVVDLSGVAGTANNPNLGIRIVSDFAIAPGEYLPANPTSNYNVTGTWRFDMVTFTGTQLPAVTYAWNTGDNTASITVTDAGTYSVEVSASGVCAGSTSVDVLVNPVFEVAQTETICEGDFVTLPDGSTTDTAGVFVFTFQSAEGCDSTITTTVIVNPVFDEAFDAVICFGETYELADGTIVDASGSYIASVPSVNGCDSTITINLTVLPILEDEITTSICEGTSYTLADGTSVTEAGEYVVVVPSSNGCDSTVTVNLTVLLNSSSSQTAAICEGDSYELPDGTLAFTAGEYVTVLQASNGCDSTITTTLTVNPVPVVDLGGDITQENPPVILDAGAGFTSYLWSTGATTQTISVTQSGDYSVTVTNANGCSASDEVNVKFTLSITYLEGVGAVSIFPNPTSDKFNLSIQGAVSGDMRVEILNNTGQLVSVDMLRDITSSYNKFYDVSTLKPGVYNVRLITNEGQATLRLIVVR